MKPILRTEEGVAWAGVQATRKSHDGLDKIYISHPSAETVKAMEVGYDKYIKANRNYMKSLEALRAEGIDRRLKTVPHAQQQFPLKHFPSLGR